MPQIATCVIAVAVCANQTDGIRTMSLARITSLFAVLVIATPVVAQDKAIPEVHVMSDLVPESAVGALLFRNVNELKQRGDAVTAKLGHPGGISMLGKLAGGVVLLGELIDDDRPLGAIWFNRDRVNNPENRYRMHPIAVGLGVNPDDLVDIAERLKIEPEALKRGETASGKGGIGYDKWYGRLHGDYVWITSHEELFEDVLSRPKTLTPHLPEARRDAINSMDCLFAVSAMAREVNQPWLVKEAGEWIEKNGDLDPEEQQAVMDFFMMFREITWGTISVRVDDGLAFDVDIFFNPKYRDAIETVIKRFNRNGGASTLAGLPDAPALLAHAAHVDGDAAFPAIAVMMRELSRNWTPRWKDFDHREFLSNIQQLELLGIFGEVWGRVGAYRTALYRNAEPNRFGLLSLVTVLDTDDADALVAEIRDLAGFIDGTGLPLAAPNEPPPAATEKVIRDLIRDLGDRRYQTRQSATVRLTLIGEPALEMVKAAQESRSLEVRRRATRIRERIEAKVASAREEALKPGLIKEAQPSFVFHAAEEERLGRPVHVIEMKTAPGAAVERHMHTAFGLGWRQIRFVPDGSRLIVLVGSDTSLLDRTLKNIDDNRPGLAVSHPERLATLPLHPKRVAEFRVGIGRFLNLARVVDPKEDAPVANQGEAADEKPDAPEREEAEESAELSGVGVTISPDFILLQWRISVDDLKQARSWWF